MSELFKSKKFLAALLGIVGVVVTFVLGKLGLNFPEERVTEMLALLAAYIVGQGIADHGKSAAQAAPLPAAPAVVNVAVTKPAAKKGGALVDTLK